MNKILKARIVEQFGTQADFAQEIKTDEAIISRVVRDRRQLSAETKKKWARMLKCNEQELFGKYSKE